MAIEACIWSGGGGGGDVDGIEILMFPLQQLPPILIDSQVGMELQQLRHSALEIDFGDRHQIHFAGTHDHIDVGPRHTAGTKTSMTQSRTRGRFHDGARPQRCRETGGSHGLKKSTPIK